MAREVEGIFDDILDIVCVVRGDEIACSLGICQPEAEPAIRYGPAEVFGGLAEE